MELPKRAKDITNQVFGSLTAIEPSHYDNGNTLYWKFKCVCGKEHIARGNSVAYAANTKKDPKLPSCGCIELERKTKHGYRKLQNTHPLYRTYRSMMNRCYNKNSEIYKYYGAKDVTVCDEWLNNPQAFIEWGLANGWKKGLHIDKDIKCDLLNILPKIYSPQTCQFVDVKENVSYATDRKNYGKHPNVRLSPTEVAEIVHKYSRGDANGVELATEYGVGTSAIYRLLKIAKQGNE